MTEEPCDCIACLIDREQYENFKDNINEHNPPQRPLMCERQKNQIDKFIEDKQNEPTFIKKTLTALLNYFWKSEKKVIR